MLKNIRKSLKIGGPIKGRGAPADSAVAKEVAKALKENKTELDLSGRGLPDVPEVNFLPFPSLPFLSSLDISRPFSLPTDKPSHVHVLSFVSCSAS